MTASSRSSAALLAAVEAAERSEPLQHGGPHVEAVLLHQLRESLDPSLPRWVIEKRLHAGRAARPPGEALFYRHAAAALRLSPLDVPRLLAARRLRQAHCLLLERVEGQHAKLAECIEDVGRGIAALEQSSAAWLQALPPAMRRELEPLVFFGPLGRRGFQGHYLNHLTRVALRAPSHVAGLPRLARIGKRLLSLERQLRGTTACLCHLDISSKNLIQSPSESPPRLTLIDWEQVSIGRVGFDLGGVVARLARHQKPHRYRRIRRRLLQAHAEVLQDNPALQLEAGLGRAFYAANAQLFHLAFHPRGSVRHEESWAWELEILERELAEVD